MIYCRKLCLNSGTSQKNRKNQAIPHSFHHSPQKGDHTMTLYIHRKAHAHGETYEVTDDQDYLHYAGKGSVFSQGAKLTLCDPDGKELVHISQVKAKEKPTFELTINGTTLATLSKETTWKDTTYLVESTKGRFVVAKDFVGNDFHITCNGTAYGTAKAMNRRWKDVIALTVTEEEHLEFSVAMLLTIANLVDHQEELG